MIDTLFTIAQLLMLAGLFLSLHLEGGLKAHPIVSFLTIAGLILILVVLGMLGLYLSFCITLCMTIAWLGILMEGVFNEQSS